MNAALLMDMDEKPPGMLRIDPSPVVRVMEENAVPLIEREAPEIAEHDMSGELVSANPVIVPDWSESVAAAWRFSKGVPDVREEGAPVTMTSDIMIVPVLVIETREEHVCAEYVMLKVRS